MPTVRVLDVDLYYEAPRGTLDIEKEVLLLLHGFGGSARHFEPLMSHLAPYICPIALDLPGHGRSGGIAPPFIEDFSRHLVEFLAAIGVRRPIWFLGHSLGGLVVLQTYLQRPELMRGLILLSSSSRLQLHPDLIAQVTSGTWDVETFRKGFTWNTPESLQRMVLNDLVSVRLPRNSDAIANWSTLDLSSVLEKIFVPVLVTVPQDDVIISPRKGRLMAAKIPAAKLRVIPAAGHYVHVEQPAVVARELSLFLRRLKRSANEAHCSAV